ncbi:hypothetical protein QUF79_04375 [Fictibacillus enclensis]|uniref:hypothetical protein n=1 Tax=Fictibacillus enclensis TaxID=1017270 RepID=UPI0025A22BD3|nr:hypothetical protein [Fictibacillus enclensis]MDM5197265.1 hypothetical protein [Fictibacillus enclensis]
MDISIINIGIIFPILLLPLLILLSQHPNKIIRSVVKVLILFVVFSLIAVIPLYSLYQVGAKALIIPLIPIVSRCAVWIITKTKIISFNLTDIIYNLLLLSIASVGFSLLSIAYEQKIQYTLLVILALWISLFVETGKYILMANFSGLVIPAYLISRSADATAFLLFIYIIGMLIIRFLDKILSLSTRARTNVERTLIVIILLGTYPVMIQRNFNFPLQTILIQFVVFIELFLIYFSLTYIIEKFNIHFVLQHYIPPIVSVILVILIINFKANANISSTFSLTFYFLVLIFTFFACLRILSPISKGGKDTSYFNNETILEGFQFYFGKNFGSKLFRLIMGSNPHLIRPTFSYSIFGICISAVSFVFFKNNNFNTLSESVIKNSYFYTLLSVLTALSFVNSISKVVEKKDANGLKPEEAIKYSTSISFNYLFTLLPFLWIEYKELRELNLPLLIICLCYVLFIVLSTNFLLILDFSKINLNGLALTRGFLSLTMMALPYISLIIAFIHFFNNDLLESLKIVYFTLLPLSLFFAVLSRLLSYDILLLSKKSLVTSLILLLLSILNLLFNKAFVLGTMSSLLLIGVKEDIAMKVTLYIQILSIMNVIIIIITMVSLSRRPKKNLIDYAKQYKDGFGK